MTELLTIGQLAERSGLKRSALRFYETQGLLQPAQRTEAGYRLYAPEAESQVRFIQRAQRLGFSLNDIRQLMDDQSADADVLALAEARFMALEHSLTELLVQQHEMQLFLRDMQTSGRDDRLYRTLSERVCSGTTAPPARSTLDWLLEHSGCVLSHPVAHAILDALSGNHVHVWQEEDGYAILIVNHAPQIEAGLQKLMELEQPCAVQHTLTYAPHPEGFLLTVTGEQAFLYAQLFLALEPEPTP